MEKPKKWPAPGRLAHRLCSIKAPPQKVARSYALGIFLASTPLVGMKIWIALFLATVLKGHRGAAAIGVYHINALTAPLYYSLSFFLGSAILGVEARMAWPDSLSALAIYQAFTASREVFYSLLVGGILLGLPASLLLYWLSLRLLQTKNHSIYEN